MKIGYKGTDKDMKCRDTQFELDKTYIINEDKEFFILSGNVSLSSDPKENSSLKCCSNQVIHYSNKIEDVYNYYNLNDDNRFFKVQILGEYVDSGSKSGTTAIRFLEELDVKTLRQQREDKYEEDRLQLDKVRKLQAKYEYLTVGGSLSLYLQGAQLTRLKENSIGDLDLIHPFWIDLTEMQGVTHIDAKNSGNTFDETYAIGGLKIDMSIDNKSKSKVVTYKGHKYRVNVIEEILYYKAMYARQKNGSKHKEDLRELMGISPVSRVEEDTNEEAW